MIVLLPAFGRDEKDLLNSLFHAQHVKMYNIAFDITRSKDMAEEAVQVAFLRIMKHFQKIKQLPCPEQVPYCVVIVKNVSKNMIRSQKQTVPVEDLKYIADGKSNPEQEYLRLEDANKLYQLLEKLPVDDRYLLVLRYGQKMAWKQIADLLGISLEAATKRGQRILKKLKSIAEKEGILHG